MYTPALFLAVLAAISTAAPAPALLLARGSVPDKVKAPKEGQCGLLVYSATTLPIGGAPTSVSGCCIGPSLEGEPYAYVINHSKVVLGGRTLKRTNPGFAADIPLENGKGTLHMSAAGIDGTSGNWGIEWTYKGKKGQGTGNPECEQYGMDNAGLATYNIHSCYFAC